MSQHSVVALIVALVLWTHSAYAQTSGSTSGAGDERVTRVESAVSDPNPAAALLAKRVASVDWWEKPFEEVIEWLIAHGEDRVNVLSRWSPLEIAGVTREDSITLQLKDMLIADVLNETLEQLGDAGDSELQYRAIDNILTISTKVDFERRLHVRVYNVADILFRVPEFQQQAPSIELQGTADGGSVFAGGGGQGGARGTPGENEQDVERRVDDLRALIVAVIEPNSWVDRDGPGTIRTFRRSLVVRNTIEVHEQIAGIFVLGD